MFDQNKVNYNPLINWLNETLGAKVVRGVAVNENQKKPFIFTQIGGMENAGIFAAVVSDVKVSLFNFWPSEESMSGTICLAYSSWGGGSNSMQIGSFWYNATTGEWTFKGERESRMSQG